MWKMRQEVAKRKDIAVEMIDHGEAVRKACLMKRVGTEVQKPGLISQLPKYTGIQDFRRKEAPSTDLIRFQYLTRNGISRWVPREAKAAAGSH